MTKLTKAYHALLEQCISKPQSVWAHLERLVPCRENAFLFNKRLGR